MCTYAYEIRKILLFFRNVPSGDENHDKAKQLPKQTYEYLIAFLVSSHGSMDVVDYILANYDELMNTKVKINRK